MKWVSPCCLLWMAIAPAYADSDPVDNAVWERLIGYCTADGEDRPQMAYGNLLEGSQELEQQQPTFMTQRPSERLGDFGAWRPGMESVPEGAQALVRRLRRCQDRVRLKVYQLGEQCLSEEAKSQLSRDLGLRRHMELPPQLQAARRFYMTHWHLWRSDDCRVHMYVLVESYNECCAVIPGY